MGSKLALAAVAALLLAGCGSSQPEAGQPESGATTAEAPAAKPSGNAPELAGTGVGGEALDVTAYRGKPVFVNVWSSW